MPVVKRGRERPQQLMGMEVENSEPIEILRRNVPTAQQEQGAANQGDFIAGPYAERYQKKEAGSRKDRPRTRSATGFQEYSVSTYWGTVADRSFSKLMVRRISSDTRPRAMGRVTPGSTTTS